jgi:hypothetical protein
MYEGTMNDRGRRQSAVSGVAELFFFVVRGQEDLAVLVEAVDQTFH